MRPAGRAVVSPREFPVCRVSVTFYSILDQLYEEISTVVRTDCKPRANNRRFGMKKGFPMMVRPENGYLNQRILIL